MFIPRIRTEKNKKTAIVNRMGTKLYWNQDEQSVLVTLALALALTLTLTTMNVFIFWYKDFPVVKLFWNVSYIFIWNWIPFFSSFFSFSSLFLSSFFILFVQRAFIGIAFIVLCTAFLFHSSGKCSTSDRISVLRVTSYEYECFWNMRNTIELFSTLIAIMYSK